MTTSSRTRIPAGRGRASLPEQFFARPVLEVAPELIGCTVVHGGTAGIIVEVEAYHQEEPACHAFVGLTPRTSTLFGPPGVAYVYRSYGIHALLNAVCEPEGVGAAVLIRALRPVDGIELMRARRQAAARGGRHGAPADPRLLSRHGAPADPRSLSRPAPALADRDLCSGPGRLTQALGIELAENGTSLSRGPVLIRARAAGEAPEIAVSTRIGITKAVELPWRFSALGDENVSRPWPWRGTRAAAEVSLSRRR